LEEKNRDTRKGATEKGEMWLLYFASCAVDESKANNCLARKNTLCFEALMVGLT